MFNRWWASGVYLLNATASGPMSLTCGAPGLLESSVAMVPVPWFRMTISFRPSPSTSIFTAATGAGSSTQTDRGRDSTGSGGAIQNRDAVARVVDDVHRRSISQDLLNCGPEG